MEDTSLVPHVEEIQSVIQQDPGNRGLARWGIGNQLLPAALSLSSGCYSLICTGFFIPQAGAIETDGPPGAIVLASALIRLGKRVTILSDKHAEEIIRAGLSAVDCSADLLTFPKDADISYPNIVTSNTTHCIAIERPGRAADGYHHNIRRDIISDHVAPLDDVFVSCRSHGLMTIGIGDGGNELGMGNVAQAVSSFVSPGRAYACVIPSDFCICAGVSNWGAYALAALLSAINRTNLLLEPRAFSRILDTIVRAGAVDGVTGGRTTTVDNLPRTWDDKVYRALYRIASEHER